MVCMVKLYKIWQMFQLVLYNYTYYDITYITYPSETNQVLELSSGYNILTINTTFEDDFLFVL